MSDDITDFIRASRESAKRLVPGAAFYVHDLNALGPELRFIVSRALDMLEAQQKRIAEMQSRTDFLKAALDASIAHHAQANELCGQQNAKIAEQQAEIERMRCELKRARSYTSIASATVEDLQRTLSLALDGGKP